jgi:hypothetical protein
MLPNEPQPAWLAAHEEAPEADLLWVQAEAVNIVQPTDLEVAWRDDESKLFGKRN